MPLVNISEVFHLEKLVNRPTLLTLITYIIYSPQCYYKRRFVFHRVGCDKKM